MNTSELKPLALAILLGAISSQVQAFSTPPPPPPAGIITYTGGPLIAPVTVTFENSQRSYTPVGHVQWRYEFGSTGDGYIANINPMYRGNYQGSLTMYGDQYGRWTDYSLGYTTTNPYTSSFHYKKPGNYPVIISFDAAHEASVTVNIIQPPAPTGLRKTGGSATKVDLAWDKVDGVDGYEIKLNSVAGCQFSWWNGGLVIGTKEWGGFSAATTSTTINDAMLCLGSQYTAQIRSYKQSIKGPWSQATPSFYL